MSSHCIDRQVHVNGPSVVDNTQQIQVQGLSSNNHSPVYLSPAEFKMKVLKKLVSSDRLQDGNIKHLQRQNSDRTLKASIYFPSGEIGTLISYEKLDTSKKSEVSAVPVNQETVAMESPRFKHRPLRLPPIILPPIFSTKPLPVVPRESYDHKELPASSFNENDYEELQECRYLRQYSPRKYRSQSASVIYG